MSVFRDKEDLLSLYKQVSENSCFVVDKIWENARFFSTITSALISLTVVSIVTMIQQELLKKYLIIGLSMLFIPIIIIALSIIGINNLKREYRRFLDWTAVSSKIQEKLGLYEQMEFKIFREDKYLLPKRFAEHRYASSEEFVEFSMKSRTSIYYYFKLLHVIYILISIFLILIILVATIIY